MMDNAIRIIGQPEYCSFLWFINFERGILGGPIGSIQQLGMKVQNIGLPIFIMLDDAILPSLTLPGNDVGSPEIVQRDNFTVKSVYPFHVLCF